MLKYKFNALIFGLIALPLSIQSAGANPLTLEDEFDYYLKYGSHSQNFYSNIMEGRDEKTKKRILKLQQQEQNCHYGWNKKEKQKAVQRWAKLSEQGEGDTSTHILYLSQVLQRQWNGEVAIALADKCHQLAQEQDDKNIRIKLAYRGFSTLGVKLTEPDYDLHNKLHALPQIISLLEDLKASTEAIQSVSTLPLPLYDKLFHEDCIPRAEICALLAVAYGSGMLLGKDDSSALELNIFDNNKEAIALYQKGLEGSTTPKQRQYYHSQIVNLVHGFSRTPNLVVQEDKHYFELKKESARQLARIYKDEHKKSKDILTRADLAFKTALAYMNAEKKEKALKYIGIVSDIPQEESQIGLCIERIKTRAEHLRLQIEDPNKLLAYEVENVNIFLKQW